MTRLAGAHVLVTGGSQGIGLEVARACLERGARVTVLARDQARLEQARAQVGGIATLSADVTDPGAVYPDDVDVLVAAAGGAEPGRFLDLDAATLERQWRLNHLGAALSVQAVLPGMLARGRGHVVLVSSIAALTGVYGYGAYGPTKAALVNLAEVLEAELDGTGIHVGVAFPPDTLTPGFERENRTKPAETAAVSAFAKPLSAERVAARIVRGIEQDRRLITVELSGAFLARAPGVAAPAVRAVMRRTVRRSRRRTAG